MVNIMVRPSGVLLSSDKQNFDFWFWKLCCLSTGYGIFTKRGFRKGDALLEYKGDMVSSKIAEQRRKSYAKERKGCFIYDVEHKGDVIWYSKLSCFFFHSVASFSDFCSLRSLIDNYMYEKYLRRGRGKITLLLSTRTYASP